MKKLSYAVIGCGEIAYWQAKGIAKTTNSKITACMDLKKEYAEAFSKSYGCRRYSEVKEVCADNSVDAVIVCLPHFLHKSVALECAAAGKHVVMEKPLATTLADADEIIKACKDAGVKLAVPYVNRYLPEVQKAKELLDKGILGRLVYLHIQYMSLKPESYWTMGWDKVVTTDWRANKEKSGGGAMLMNCSHYIDYFYYLTGLRAERIYAEYDTYATKVEVEDLMNMLIRFKGGATGLVQSSSMTPGGLENINRIVGTEGQIMLTNPLKVFVTKDRDGFAANKWNEVPLEKPNDPAAALRTKFFELFSDAVLNNKPVPISGEEARVALEVVLKGYEAGEKKIVIELA